MNAKRVKRMCSVKGCRNTETYAISRIKEFGGVIICKSCLEEALQAVNNPEVNRKEATHKEEMPLFYHPETEKKEGVPEDKAGGAEKSTAAAGQVKQEETAGKPEKDSKARNTVPAKASKRK